MGFHRFPATVEPLWVREPANRVTVAVFGGMVTGFVPGVGLLQAERAGNTPAAFV
ncbi:hypothetical protein [Aquisalimonas sp.]|uniref:hypothetical protein n=1 Tax=Aquisalimonas sp. TaxID=1872621 RepID=UPI0025C0D012|nr:hypothetical protein [Aquisalimonas sp.]